MNAKKLARITAGLILFASAAAWAADYTCAEDGMKMWFTGQTRTTQNGTLLYQYTCPNNHKSWGLP